MLPGTILAWENLVFLAGKFKINPKDFPCFFLMDFLSHQVRRLLNLEIRSSRFSGTNVLIVGL